MLRDDAEKKEIKLPQEVIDIEKDFFSPTSRNDLLKKYKEKLDKNAHPLFNLTVNTAESKA